MDKADFFREAIKTFVRVQAANRLATLGSAMPEMKARTGGRRSGQIVGSALFHQMPFHGVGRQGE